MPKPRQPVPPLEVPTLDGGTWKLSEQKPENFTMVVFYRGLHCPICSRYLADLDRRSAEFKKRGVEVLVVSSDDEARARQAASDWKLNNLTVGYGLDLGIARDWGLYVSSGVGKTSAGIEEPERFNEPGLFLIRPDGTLYFGTVQTMPFARPSFGDILPAIDFVLARNYPARGEA
ncbi:MAG: peroxiredoxin-like family protein [Kiloniellaceae bacterium]